MTVLDGESKTVFHLDNAVVETSYAQEPAVKFPSSTKVRYPVLIRPMQR